MARVLLDTTYLLPVAGIGVRGVETDVLRKVRVAGHEVFISDISLFELLAKGASLVAQGRADEQRILLAMRSILADEKITRIAPYEEGVARTAVTLRRHHSDFVDCIILASALDACQAFLTEDRALSRNEAVLSVVSQARPGFVISTWKGLRTT